MCYLGSATAHSVTLLTMCCSILLKLTQLTEPVRPRLWYIRSMKELSGRVQRAAVNVVRPPQCRYSVPIRGGARYHQRRARAVRRDVFLELAGDERLLCNKRPLGVLRGLRLKVGRCTSGELLGLVVRLEPHICARSALLLLCCHPDVRHGNIEDFRDYISFSLPQPLQTIEHTR